ncbi:MAG: hypothetical protein JSW64_07930 [Candidatus Zixiibacteriota bacterium]|nr:MAG: hypothetical protein JSW64_07930 [candidate division Zixibacteria bacterium]
MTIKIQKEIGIIRIILFLILAAIMLWRSGLRAQTSADRFVVKYESSEHIYIDGGSEDGVAVGDTLQILKADSAVAEIVAVFVSDHSSSCKIISGLESGLRGLSARQKHIKPVIVEISEKEQEVRRPEPEIKTDLQTEKKPPEKSSFIRGRAALQLYTYNDRGPADLDVVQPTLRANLEIQNLGNQNLTLKIRTRTRYTDRTRSYNSNVSDSEWRNRIYETSLNYDNGGRGIGFRLGRIIAGSFSGAGYVDGLMGFNRFSETLEVGIFAGTQPAWQYADFQASLQKYGAYINFKKGHRRGIRYESTAALAAEYHSSTVSREFVHLRNRISQNGKWNIYQSLDLDINRDWRKERTGKSVIVSNLLISGSVNPCSWLRVTASYDNRKRYWTYEIQSLDERLFDDRYRRGVKTGLTFSLPHNYMISTDLGFRGIDGEDESRYSWSASLRKSDFTALRLSYGLNYTFFSDIYSEGRRFSANLGRYFRSFSINLEYGFYKYDYNTYITQRSSDWIRIESFFRISRSFYLSANGQRGFGDDLNGDLFLTEFGYRF